MSTDHAHWLRNFHPAPDAPARLVCLPHAGGSASYFFPVSSALSPSVDVHAVQYPGRQDRRREPFVHTVTDLADQVTAAIVPLADRPLALFGHSMGGALAFEVALRLEACGILATDLFVSGRRAPSTLRRERTHLLPDAELVAELDTLSGTDGRIFGDGELMQLVLPAIRNDLRAIETYQWRGGRSVRSPIHALVGTDDPKASLEEASSWTAHTSGGFALHVYEGGHFYLNAHARSVIALIADRLDQAAPASSQPLAA